MRDVYCILLFIRLSLIVGFYVIRDATTIVIIFYVYKIQCHLYLMRQYPTVCMYSTGKYGWALPILGLRHSAQLITHIEAYNILLGTHLWSLFCGLITIDRRRIQNVYIISTGIMCWLFCLFVSIYRHILWKTEDG